MAESAGGNARAAQYDIEVGEDLVSLKWASQRTGRSRTMDSRRDVSNRRRLALHTVKTPVRHCEGRFCRVRKYAKVT
eukprot:CAMPEP_0185844858 /NCGR_PEP_ID=MMETSP1354-20130828/960_1 /TAXON_ID=708628 /ORGANISM="Erythrolobus madagascarensis, Strain CCMP3276" /LENGTH=76 /DNA_ID=CAMNT_0028544657 /DNA_START=183 /DNA_END=409 /DNA_ORIENTATION=-